MVDWYEDDNIITKEILYYFDREVPFDSVIVGRRIFFDADSYRHVDVEILNGKIEIERQSDEPGEQIILDLADPDSIDKTLRIVKIWFRVLEREIKNEDD